MGGERERERKHEKRRDETRTGDTGLVTMTLRRWR